MEEKYQQIRLMKERHISFIDYSAESTWGEEMKRSLPHERTSQ